MLAKISAEAAAINQENLSKEEKVRLLKNLKQSSKPKLVPKKNAAQDIGHVYEHTKTEVRTSVSRRIRIHMRLTEYSSSSMGLQNAPDVTIC